MMDPIRANPQEPNRDLPGPSRGSTAPGSGRTRGGPWGGAESQLEAQVRTCPNCGKELAERRCKLYCPDPCCGYYLSCADYY